MCYPVCGMVHIKESLLLVGKSSLRNGSSRLSFTICQMPYICNRNVLRTSLIKTLPSLLSQEILKIFFASIIEKTRLKINAI